MSGRPLSFGRGLFLAAAVFPLAVSAMVQFPPETAAAAEPERPSAFELLERVRARYGGLEGYAGSGVLELRRGPGEGELAGRFRLSMLEDAEGSFRLELVEVTGEASGETAAAGGGEPRRLVVWRRRGEESFVYDGARGEAGEYRPVGSTLAALAELPGGRELGVEAYPIAALLAGGEGALSRPPAASLDGPEPCPGAPAAACWRLRHPSADGRLETELWIETGEPVVRRAEVRTVADPLGFAAALADAGLDPGARPAADRPRVAVRTTFEEAGAPGSEAVARVTLEPPPGTRRVESWSGAVPEGDADDPQIAFGETIDVALAGFVVRVVDGRGDPVTGLGPDDFRVTAGGREVPVRSVDYYASGSGALPDLRAPDLRAPAADPAAAPARPAPPPPPPGFPPKLVVLFVQADFNSLRTRGHLKLLPFVERFLGELPPDDLVAVVSFDSHLEPWLDLTTDREAAHEAVWRAIHFGADPPSGRRIERRRGPSLFDRIDPVEAADAAWVEEGLGIVARALVPLPGEKVVVFLGWGIGYRTRDGVRMRRDYRPAVEALTAARASVLAFDVTEAHYHDLELGLQQVAADTGGTYERTVDFPTQAIRRLTALLASHYVLTVDLADLPPAARQGREELEVELVGRRGARVLVRPLGTG